MFDMQKLICYCNDLSMQDVSDIVKEHNITSLDQILECIECSVGDKCEACHGNGYENDGYSLAMIISLVKQKRI